VENKPDKPDWKDFFALVIAAYQVLLLPVIVIFAAVGLVFFLLSRLLA
jgi:hypothetical protein